jgi:hypothetical protein
MCGLQTKILHVRAELTRSDIVMLANPDELDGVDGMDERLEVLPTDS